MDILVKKDFIQITQFEIIRYLIVVNVVQGFDHSEATSLTFSLPKKKRRKKKNTCTVIGEDMGHEHFSWRFDILTEKKYAYIVLNFTTRENNMQN